MTPLSRMLELADAAANKFLDDVEASTRRVRRRDRVRCGVFLAGAVISTAVTARFIELDQPWWIITFGAVLTATWAGYALRWRGYVVKANELLSEVRDARQGVDAADLQGFLVGPRSRPRHATPKPDAAGETDANPAPEGATS